MDGRGLIGLFVIVYILLVFVARCDIAHASPDPRKGGGPGVGHVGGA